MCLSIKTFIDVTHKILLFYYLYWKVVIHLTALLLCCAVIRESSSLTQIRKNQFSEEYTCLLSLPRVLTRLNFPDIV